MLRLPGIYILRSNIRIPEYPLLHLTGAPSEGRWPETAVRRRGLGFRWLTSVKLPLGGSWWGERGRSLLLWVGECGDDLWLEGKWVKMMDKVPPTHEGRQSRIWGISTPIGSYSSNPRLTRCHSWLQSVEGKRQRLGIINWVMVSLPITCPGT